ncbi:ABC transporter permease [Yinghuangia sp. ASG 101]|uniref:ABC transporter permease n=1 Tax=Yinghuangia sp. ASG 101 TaxID=2896848 RepID=UPI001E60A0C1|nr:ABC transporter permease [Yinghuangia sp. ASG 101]UGQ12107.1 ABC transporter permease [Yinghuangia sp. ASG 101]
MRRVLSGVLAVAAVSVVVFAATQALPSDPARTVLGPEAPQSSVDELRRQLGLDRPVTAQYWAWLSGVLRGDLGTSLDSHVPVGHIVSERLGNTLALVACATGVSVLLALLLGTLAAVYRDRVVDRVVTSAAVAAQALPAFVTAVVLVIVFSTTVFHVLPAASLIEPGRSPWDRPDYLVLPAAALVLSVTPYLLRQVRAAVAEALDSDYVAAARLRGVPEARLLVRHVLPNSLVPLVQAIALTLSVLLGGSLVVEAAFTYPGLGGALNGAVQVRDVPVVQAAVLVVAAGVVAVNLLADLATVLLTPALRTGAAS